MIYPLPAWCCRDALRRRQGARRRHPPPALSASWSRRRRRHSWGTSCRRARQSPRTVFPPRCSDSQTSCCEQEHVPSSRVQINNTWRLTSELTTSSVFKQGLSLWKKQQFSCLIVKYCSFHNKNVNYSNLKRISAFLQCSLSFIQNSKTVCQQVWPRRSWLRQTRNVKWWKVEKGHRFASDRKVVKQRRSFFTFILTTSPKNKSKLST